MDQLPTKTWQEASSFVTIARILSHAMTIGNTQRRKATIIGWHEKFENKQCVSLKAKFIVR